MYKEDEDDIEYDDIEYDNEVDYEDDLDATDDEDDYAYDVDEDNRNYEREGLTDKITPYSYVDKEYPNIVLDIENKELPKYKVEALTVMVSAKITAEEESNMISLYLKIQNNLMKLGKIHKRQVKAIKKLFKDYKVMGYLDKDTELKDELIYVLS